MKCRQFQVLPKVLSSGADMCGESISLPLTDSRSGLLGLSVSSLYGRKSMLRKKETVEGKQGLSNKTSKIRGLVSGVKGGGLAV